MTATMTQTTTLSVTPHGIGPNGARLFVVPSRTQDEPHIVAFVNNTTTCTCDGSFYRGHCAHGRAVEDYLIAERRNQINPVDPMSVDMARKLGILAPARTA